MPFGTKKARVSLTITRPVVTTHNFYAVKLTSGRSVRIGIPVYSMALIDQLCHKVAEEENVPAETIILKYDGKVLKKNRGMSDYGIRKEMELEVQIIPKETLKLHLHLPGTPQEIISIEINNTSCNEEIKTKFLAAKPCHADKYTIFRIGDMELKMRSYMYAYEDCIKDGDNIEVMFPHEDAARDREEREENERQVQEYLCESVTKLMSDIPNIQIGLIAHGDYCDERLYVLRKHDIASDMSKLVKFVEETKGSSGQRYFACYEWALRHANGLSWREDSAKALVIIGDVFPHPPSYTNLNICWREELDKLCAKGVKVYGVQAKHDVVHESDNSFYRLMAGKSGGTHIKFQHISLITDMFLAVCSQESEDDQPQAYVDEVKNEGRMTEEMMEEAEKETEEAAELMGGAEAAGPSPSKSQQEERCVPAEWWESDDSDGPTFHYIYSMNYWHQIGVFRLCNLRSAIKKSFRFKTLMRGFSPFSER